MFAYGLNFVGPGLPRDQGRARDQDGAPAVAWAPCEVRQVPGPAPHRTRLSVSSVRSTLEVEDHATLTFTTEPFLLEVRAPAPIPAESLVHPVLTFAGAAAARWHGRLALHAGAVVIGGGAWVVLGSPGQGKTTLVTQLDQRGHPVLADDLCVVAGQTVLAGPRVGDLRSDAATALGLGVEVDTPLGRPRWRHQFGPAPFDAPLAGIIELCWSDALNVGPVSPAERVATLASHEALSLEPTNPRGLLDLLSVPMWRVARPADWRMESQTVDAVLQLAS